MSDKIQEDFLSTVSHELRTPLTSIRGFAQTILASWDRIDDENKKKFLKIIEDQSNRLINLVENMLSVNNLQNFSKKMICTSANSISLIKPIIQIVSQQYPKHFFKTEFNNRVPNIFVDLGMFQQIMTNLIENAAKYSPEGSEIVISTGFSSKDNFISIKVKDNGIGIKQEDFEKIFTKFSRIDNPLTRKIQGSGLGLYIVKTLILKMGGQINLESSENKGSTFEVLLPFDNIENQAKNTGVSK